MTTFIYIYSYLLMDGSVFTCKSESPLNAMNSHHRFYVYIRCKHSIPAKQIFDELMSVHKDTCLSHNTIFRWIRKIQTGCFELQKGKSPGRPISNSNASNVQKVKGLIDENCRLSCYDLESITGFPKTTFHGILVSHLGL